VVNMTKEAHQVKVLVVAYPERLSAIAGSTEWALAAAFGNDEFAENTYLYLADVDADLIQHASDESLTSDEKQRLRAFARILSGEDDNL